MTLFIVLLFATVTSQHKNMVSVPFILVFLPLLRGDSTEASSAEVSDCFKVDSDVYYNNRESDLKPEVCVRMTSPGLTPRSWTLSTL